MIPLTITTDIEAAPWDDLDYGKSLNAEHALEPVFPGSMIPMATIERVGLLRHGTVEGRAVVAIVVRLADGSFVLAETTYRLAKSAALALAASPAGREEA